MQVICEGAVQAPGHTEAVLQELFIAGQDSLASYAPGLSAEITASLAAGRTAFPMSSLLQSHSSECNLVTVFLVVQVEANQAMVPPTIAQLECLAETSCSRRYCELVVTFSDMVSCLALDRWSPLSPCQIATRSLLHSL